MPPEENTEGIGVAGYVSPQQFAIGRIGVGAVRAPTLAASGRPGLGSRPSGRAGAGFWRFRYRSRRARPKAVGAADLTPRRVR